MNEILDEPPTHCPHCKERGETTAVPAEAWEQLRSGGIWFMTDGACRRCDEHYAEATRNEIKRQGLTYYRENVPKKYRPIADGGRTDLSHADWRAHKGAAQVAFLRKWNRDSHPFAGIIGPGGHCKSRAVAIAARDLAATGRRVLWVNGSNLGWCAEQQKRGGFDTKAQAYHSLKDMREADVLVLDDLWKGSESYSYHSSLYDLLEFRGSRERTLIWTANTHPSEFPNIPADLRDPLVGRILEDSHYFNLYS